MASRLSKKEAIQFALKWLEPLKDYEKPYTYKDLANYFNRDRKTISDGVQMAFGEKHVVLVESDTDSRPDPFRHRNQSLESTLCRKFSTLKEAIVIGIPDQRSHQPTSQRATEQGDLLHEHLGRAMAKFLVETVGFDLREGESFGFGSGRGVYQTVRYVSEFAKERHAIRVNELNLVSLCGNCQVRSETGSSPILDANYNANEMASALEGPYSVKPVMAESIAPVDILRLREEAPFVTWPPDIALLGVGVLTGGHRFVNIEEIKAFVEPILPQLRELNSLTQELEQPSFCAVGDICNYLFRVPKPRGLRLTDEEKVSFERIGELVEMVNQKLLTIEPQKLAARNTRLLLVAGGAEKARAIRYLMGGPFGLNVKVLCTDQATAAALTGPEED